MDNPAAAAAGAPGKAAKGVGGLLKNKPPAFYLILVAGVAVAAYLIHKREQNAAPADPVPDTQTGDGSFSPDYAPTDGALAGGYGGGSNAVDQTGAYGGGPIPTSNGFLYDPATGMVYGALPDSQMVTPSPVPELTPGGGTGGGAPSNGGVEVHAPVPVVISQTPQPSTWTCPSDYPNHGPNPGSCFKVVCLKKGDGHGHGPGKWHVYRDGSWHQVTSGSC
jgi:hypothetical protein